MNWDFLPYITGVIKTTQSSQRVADAMQQWDAQNYPIERRRLIRGYSDYEEIDAHGFTVDWSTRRPHPFNELARMVAFRGRRVPPMKVKQPQPVHDPIVVTKLYQYVHLIEACFPDRHGLHVMEFGRLRARDHHTLHADGGSTMQLAKSDRVQSITSIDTDDGTLEALEMWLTPEDRLKVACVRGIDEVYSHAVDLLIVDANDCSWQNLDLMRSAERFLTPDSIIAVDDMQHQVKPFLIREVLRDTHTERIMGDLAVFVPDGE